MRKCKILDAEDSFPLKCHSKDGVGVLGTIWLRFCKAISEENIQVIHGIDFFHSTPKRALMGRLHEH